MLRNENRLFGRHFETVHIFYIFFLKYGCDWCIHIWCKNNLKSLVGKWFPLGGSMEPRLCTNGGAGYLMQLSVNKWESNNKTLFQVRVSSPNLRSVGLVNWFFTSELGVLWAELFKTWVLGAAIWTKKKKKK